MVDVFARKGFRFKGHAEVVTEGPRWEQALAFYRERGTRTEIDGQRRTNAVILRAAGPSVSGGWPVSTH